AAATSAPAPAAAAAGVPATTAVGRGRQVGGGQVGGAPGSVRAAQEGPDSVQPVVAREAAPPWPGAGRSGGGGGRRAVGVGPGGGACGQGQQGEGGRLALLGGRPPGAGGLLAGGGDAAPAPGVPALEEDLPGGGHLAAQQRQLAEDEAPPEHP